VSNNLKGLIFLAALVSYELGRLEGVKAGAKRFIGTNLLRINPVLVVCSTKRGGIPS
jgi:hypothetical protein